MDRRGFLKTTSGALAYGTTMAISTATAVSKGLDETATSHADNQMLPPEELYVAAIFPSKAWGNSAWQLEFDKGMLTGLDESFPHESIISIGEGRFFTSGDRTPTLAIAVANPHDPVTWNAALEECARAKRTGALTLLFAAHPYPDFSYPFDPQILSDPAEDASAAATDIVIHCVTMNLFNEFPRIVYALTKIEGSFPGCDLSDVRAGLTGAKQAVYFYETAKGPKRAERAIRYAFHNVNRASRAFHQFNGGVTILEANTWGMHELEAIHDRMQGSLPTNSTTILGRAEHYHIDPWIRVHAIVTYTKS